MMFLQVIEVAPNHCVVEVSKSAGELLLYKKVSKKPLFNFKQTEIHYIYIYIYTKILCLLFEFYQIFYF